MSEEKFIWLKERIVDRWDDVLTIAWAVPTPEQIKDSLQKAGAPVSGAEIGLNEEEFRVGVEYSHYLRNRFTVNKLRRILGLTETNLYAV
jgi:glycerol dehydrogenase-like iron-containing ADH family enzyme